MQEESAVQSYVCTDIWDIKELSVETKTALLRKGIRTAGDLSVLTAKEMYEEGIPITDTREASVNAMEYTINAIITSFRNSGNPYYVYLLPEIRTQIRNNLWDAETPEDCLLPGVIRGKFFDEMFNEALMMAMEDRKELTEEALDMIFPGELGKLKYSRLNRWVREKFLDRKGGNYIMHCITVLDHASAIENERHRGIVCMKLSGATLEMVSKKFGVSKERVRQIVKKNVMKFSGLKEDEYAPLYQKYRLNEDIFAVLTELSEASYYYMKIKYKEGDKDPEGLLEEDISESSKTRLMDYFYRDHIREDGILLTKNRRTVAIDILKKHKKPIHVSTLREEYEALLKKHGLENDHDLKVGPRYFATTLTFDKNVLLTTGGMVSYTPLTKKDAYRIAKTIGLFKLQDVELSAEYFYSRFPDLMEECGLRNGNELHNLLKKHIKVEGIVFSRQPTIRIGNYDRKKQMMDMLTETGAIRKREFAEMYMQKYGIDYDSFTANYLPLIKEYRHEDLFDVNNP